MGSMTCNVICFLYEFSLASYGVHENKTFVSLLASIVFLPPWVSLLFTRSQKTWVFLFGGILGYPKIS